MGKNYKRMKDDELEGLYVKLDAKYNELDTIIQENSLDENKIILIKMIQDISDLLKNIITDIVMYDLSIDNFNHEELYQGHYHLFYSINKINMVFERLIYFLGIVYNTEFYDDLEKNKIKDIWKNLKNEEKTVYFNDFKKNTSVNAIINDIFGNENWRIINAFRKYNDHDESIHLDDDIIIKELKVEKNIYDEQILEFLELYKKSSNEFNEKEKREILFNYTINKKLNEKLVPAICWMLIKLTDLLDECTNLYKDLIICRENVCIQLKNLYYWNVNAKFRKKNINKFNVIKLQKLFFDSKEIKDKAKRRSFIIENNLKVVFRNPVIIKLEGYFVDSAFRLTECIRSLMEMINIMKVGHYEFLELVDADYFYYATIIKLYSCYEKAGKVLYTALEHKNVNLKISRNDKQFNKIGNITAEMEEHFLNSLKIAKRIQTKPEYQKYLAIRNKTYHGIREKYVLDTDEFSISFYNNMYILEECIKDLVYLLENINSSLDNFYLYACKINKN